jgi:membrane protein implicated in regulation of membrane protease activity
MPILDMALSTVWWLVCGGLIAAELLTGTFYLLMLSLGAAAAALAAHANMTPPWQLVIGAVVGAVAVTLWHLKNGRAQRHADTSRDANVHLDLGETVQVTEWNAQGLALVKHRGAQWTALVLPEQPQTIGAHRIVQMMGNRLVVEKI